MARTLGLDIGTNSIGWCLVEDGKKIIAMGSRIFPVGVKEDSYAKSGTEESRNAARRTARGIRRGYDRYKQRRAKLEALLTEHGMMFDKTTSLPTKKLYGLRKEALDRKLELQELGRILFLINQRRGFKSNRKEAAKEGDDAKKLTAYKQAMSDFEAKLKASGLRTVGEYLASLFDDQPANWHNVNEPRERIREHQRIKRELYQQEFDLIWAKQSAHYPALLTTELKDQLRDKVIFFQRKLKSAKHLVSKCRFEPAKRVMAKSDPLFQEFRLWQRLRDIRVTYGDRVNDPLTNHERGTLAAELGGKASLGKTEIKDLLGFKRSATFNDIGEKLLGNVTVARIKDAVGEDWYWKQDPEKRLKLWHTLYFAEDEGWIETYAQKSLGMNDEQAKRYAEVNLELDYGSISHKAAQKILPFLIDGFDFATACAQAGYHHSQRDLDKADRVLDAKLDTSKMDPIRNPLVQMTVNETARLVNAVITEHGKPDLVRVELLRDLKKPKAVREKMRNSMRDKEKLRDEYRAFLQARKVLPEIRMSDIKKFELWLELEYSVSALEKLDPNVDLRAFAKFAAAVSPKDKDKFRLWLECGRVSPYTGEMIPLNKLFTEAIHVEHILPYSRSIDDSFANKTLCEDHVNDAKGNLTPLEYFEQKRTPAELKAFKLRVQNFSQGKLDKFLATEVKEDFLNSQFTNSAYIGTEVRDLLRTTCKDVRVTNGQLTGLLRNRWSLNRLLNNEADQKNRDDHRHHAVDALVIACTTQSLVQKISSESKFDHTGWQKLPDIGLPWSTFRTDAGEKLSGLLVSYKGGKRLLSSKLNKYRHSKAHDGKPEKYQKTLAVRGALHEETLYGRITIQGKGTKEDTYVVRKALTSLTKEEQLDNIVDPVVRKTIQDHVAAHNGSLKEAMKQTVYMPVKEKNKGKLVPIKNVRMRVNTEEMVELRPKTFVEPGSNYCIAIYEDAKGKRAFRTVNFLAASRKALKKLPIYPKEYDGKTLLMALQQRDLVVIYDQHPDEIQWNSPNWLAQHLYTIKKMDKNGKIGLVLHKASNANPDFPKRYPAGTVAMKTAGTIKALPVHITTTGQIERK
ncbi:MAG TPA: HNH endonuclease domain-containing protein [Flavobacteriales bacterium]|nr:HNH endonuclease domain-containing protein [Flavobacteriales bacterium]